MERKTKIKFTDFECNLLVNGMIPNLILPPEETNLRQDKWGMDRLTAVFFCFAYQLDRGHIKSRGSFI